MTDSADQPVLLRWITRDDPLYLGERRLRYEVLRAPLGMPEGSELNPSEDRCAHCVAVIDGRVVGCVLALPDVSDPRRVKLLQMAVDPTLQRRHIGAQLVRELEHRFVGEGATEIFMHARESVLGFYESLGYRAVGERFSEVGLGHRLMVKTTPSQS
jgi:ribosomal protein S18 acetylase RimI-like enzyme